VRELLAKLRDLLQLPEGLAEGLRTRTARMRRAKHARTRQRTERRARKVRRAFHAYRQTRRA
jgi:hypothetical protein